MGKDNHNGRKIVAGAAIAGIAGYLAGIFTAPKSGKETRQDLADKATEIKGEALGKLDEAKAELDNMLQDAKTKSVALSAKAREEFNETVARAKDARNKLAVVIKAVRAGESQQPELDKALKQAKQASKNLSKYLKS